jgi:hypothetical protein
LPENSVQLCEALPRHHRQQHAARARSGAAFCSLASRALDAGLPLFGQTNPYFLPWQVFARLLPMGCEERAAAVFASMDGSSA